MLTTRRYDSSTLHTIVDVTHTLGSRRQVVHKGYQTPYKIDLVQVSSEHFTKYDRKGNQEGLWTYTLNTRLTHFILTLL